MKSTATIATLRAHLYLAAVLGLLLIPRTGWSASISCGQTVTNTTTTVSQIDTYTYAGTAGQVLSVSLWSSLDVNPNNYHPMVADIYSPGGQLVVSVTDTLYYLIGSGGAVNVTLTDSGTYTILVHNSTYVYTSSYALSIQSVNNGGCSSQAISCGQTVISNTTYQSEMDAYSYAGTAGQVLSVSLWSSLDVNPNFYHPMVADIYGPGGELLISVTDNLYYQVGSGGTVNLMLTNSGTYTILVHNSTYIYTSSYALSVQSLIGGGCNSQTITCGQTVTGSTSIPSQVDAYSYAGTTGQVLSVSLWSSLDPNPNFYQPMVAAICGPDGQVLSYVSDTQYYLVGSGGTANLTLTNSGTYTILVFNSARIYTSSYALSIQSVIGGGCNSQTISCGQTVTGSTSIPSQVDAYSYAGTTGQVLSVSLWSSLDPNPNFYQPMVAAICGPDGQVLSYVFDTQYYLVGSGGAANLTLTNSGTYTILVFNSARIYTSSYALSIQSVNSGGCNGITIPCGQTIDGQISLGSQMNGYELVANAGEHVILSDSGFSGMVVDIYNPTGSNVVNMGVSTPINYTFADTGIYTVVVHSGNYIGTGSYGLTLTAFGGCAALPTVSVTPTNLAVTIGSAPTFTATASGPTSLFYQWRFGNVLIIGATDATFSITDVQTNDLGIYQLVVSNPGGAVTNSVRLQGIPSITWSNPADITYGTALDPPS